mmetsp:Transcript_132312/g.300717  ORF Transcript_132312/g.300717 Transcript_132312/m.300717 type:complete len:240 (-) Transcript_132312:709-1428(-)
MAITLGSMVAKYSRRIADTRTSSATSCSSIMLLSLTLISPASPFNTWSLTIDFLSQSTLGALAADTSSSGKSIVNICRISAHNSRHSSAPSESTSAMVTSGNWLWSFMNRCASSMVSTTKTTPPASSVICLICWIHSVSALAKRTCLSCRDTFGIPADGELVAHSVWNLEAKRAPRLSAIRLRIGRRTKNFEPWLGPEAFDSTQIIPPWALAIPSATVRPKPIPSNFLVSGSSSSWAKA